MTEKKGNDTLLFEYAGAKQRVLNNSTVGGSTTQTLYIHGVNEYPLWHKLSDSGRAEEENGCRKEKCFHSDLPRLER